MQLAAPPALPSAADIRTVEILTSVRQAFVEKGFDGASMQDLARAAGMSVGNFYRYFSSKAAIIQAMIQRDAADLEADFGAIINSAKPMQALRAVIRHRIVEECCAGDSALWTEIEAASRRSPEIAEAARHMEIKVQGFLIDIFAIETGLTVEEATRRFSAPAAYVLVMFKAASCLSGAPALDQAEVRQMILRSIDDTLDKISASGGTQPTPNTTDAIQLKDLPCV